MKRWLCIWLPNWPIQRILVARPELRRTPVVLFQRDTRRGQLVAACCRAARRQGVRADMPLAEARALVQRATTRRLSATARPVTDSRSSRLDPDMPWDAGFLGYDPELDRQVLQQLARQCQPFSPVVGLEEPHLKKPGLHTDPLQEPASLLLDLTSTVDRWGGAAELARQVVRQLAQPGYWLQLGIADTLGAAWALAHYRLDQDTQSRVAGVTAFRLERMLLQLASPGHIRAVLSPLPVDALRLHAATSHLLQQLGVESIGQLDRLPRDGLATRFGPDLLRRLDQAFGAADEVITGHQEAPSFSTHWHAEHPTDRRDTIEQIVKHLVHHLGELLAAQQQGALQLECCLCYQPSEQPTLLSNQKVPRDRLNLTTNLFQPTSCAQHLWQLLRVQLDATRVPGPVTEIRLTATASAGSRVKQSLLWSPEGRHNSQLLADLFDRLSNRLGTQVVGHVRLHATALPEDAYTLVPLAGPEATRARRHPASAKHLSPGQRPLHLLNPPWPIQVEAAHDGTLQLFTAGPHVHAIQQHWGPERIETRWWQGPCVQRDYYRVLCRTGARFWLYQNLANQAWFLQGTF